MTENWLARFEMRLGWYDDDAVFATRAEAEEYALSEANERDGVNAFSVATTTLPRNAFVADGMLVRIRSPRPAE